MKTDVKTDAELKKDVLAEFSWDPAVKSTEVGVMVRDGVVSLTGHLDTYAEKFAVERAVQRVSGVRAIAVEMDVKLDPAHMRSDSEIAAAAELSLKWHAQVAHERVQVKVEKGWITLRGECEWDYQRAAAGKAVRSLLGVVGVSNYISLKPQTTPADVAKRIREALGRHVQRETDQLDIAISGSRITLRGKVSSWAERRAIQGAAWSAPGVANVVNELTIAP